MLLASIACCSGSAGNRVPLMAIGRTDWVATGESREQAAARHAAVAQRRKDPVVTLHRGASFLAPENTIAAFDAALDLGADGWEIDVQRTLDGTLVVFHDSVISRVLDGEGTVRSMSYEELLLYPFRADAVESSFRHWVPTLGETLELARERRALVHLDIKQRGIDSEIARMLDTADMWDHIVSIDDPNSDIVRGDRRYQPLSWRCVLTFYSDKPMGTEDADWQTVVAKTSLGGQHIQAEDPRLVLQAIGRPVGAVASARPRKVTGVQSPPGLSGLVAGVFGINPSLDSRLAGARLVNYYGSEAATKLASQYHPEAPCSTRKSVAWTLAMTARYFPDSFDDSAHEVVLSLAHDADPDVRAEAATALGYLARSDDLPTLLSLALDHQKKVRTLESAAGAVSYNTALAEVRASAAKALAHFPGRRDQVSTVLSELVAHPGLPSSDGTEAARTIGQLKLTACQDVLARCVLSDGGDITSATGELSKEQKASLPWQDSDLRAEAAGSLARMGDDEALAHLAALFGKAGEDWMTLPLTDAIAELANREDPAALSACVQALFSPTFALRHEAFFRLLDGHYPRLAADAIAHAVVYSLETGNGVDQCAMALDLLGRLAQRSRAVEDALTKGAASSIPAVRERAGSAQSLLYGR